MISDKASMNSGKVPAAVQVKERTSEFAVECRIMSVFEEFKLKAVNNKFTSINIRNIAKSNRVAGHGYRGHTQIHNLFG